VIVFREKFVNNIARWGFALALLPLAACNSNPANPLASTVPLPQTPPSVSAQDQRFMDQAAASDMFEIQSSQLALQRSRNARTRSYAQRMIDDHTMTSQRLAQLAQANGITLPTGLGPEQQRALAAIQNTSRIFDSEYFRQQALAHQAAIQTYETEANSGYNNDVKLFAQQTLPTLQEHLQIAEAGRQMPMGRIPARSTVP
jgi:putative membrane protein